jgi:hypothetical protein
MQFGPDWPGVFLRGDNACWIALNLVDLKGIIDQVISGKLTIADLKQAMATSGTALNQIISELSDAQAERPGTVVQYMKPFDQCFDHAAQNDG